MIEYWQQRSETGVNVTIYCSYRPRSDDPTQLIGRHEQGLKKLFIYLYLHNTKYNTHQQQVTQAGEQSHKVTLIYTVLNFKQK